MGRAKGEWKSPECTGVINVHNGKRLCREREAKSRGHGIESVESVDGMTDGRETRVTDSPSTKSPRGRRGKSSHYPHALSARAKSKVLKVLKVTYVSNFALCTRDTEQKTWKIVLWFLLLCSLLVHCPREDLCISCPILNVIYVRTEHLVLTSLLSNFSPLSLSFTWRPLILLLSLSFPFHFCT